jgi:hypothetical protein
LRSVRRGSCSGARSGRGPRRGLMSSEALSNFVAATIIAASLVSLDLYSSYALPALLLGFWLMMLMFGTGIKKFLNEGERTPESGQTQDNTRGWESRPLAYSQSLAT